MKLLRLLMLGCAFLASMYVVFVVAVGVLRSSHEPPAYDPLTATAEQRELAELLLSGRSTDVFQTPGGTTLYIIKFRGAQPILSFERPAWLGEGGAVVLTPDEKEIIRMKAPAEMPHWLFWRDSMSTEELSNYRGGLGMTIWMMTYFGICGGAFAAAAPWPWRAWLFATPTMGLVLLLSMLMNNPSTISGLDWFIWPMIAMINFAVLSGLLHATIQTFKDWWRSTTVSHDAAGLLQK